MRRRRTICLAEEPVCVSRVTAAAEACSQSVSQLLLSPLRQEAGKLRKQSDVSWVRLRSDCIIKLSNSALPSVIIIGVFGNTKEIIINPLTFRDPHI